MDFRISDEQVVDHAPVVGIERAELMRLAGGFHPLGDFADLGSHLVLADCAEMLAVHLDAPGIGELAPQDAVDEVLQVIEPVAVVADDRLTIGRVDLQAWAVIGFLDFDGRCQTEVP